MTCQSGNEDSMLPTAEYILTSPFSLSDSRKIEREAEERRRKGNGELRLVFLKICKKSCRYHAIHSRYRDTEPIGKGRSTPKTGSSTTTTGKLSSLSGGSSSSSSSVDEVFPDGRILKAPNLRIFSFAELRTATRNFKPEMVLGEGGFGRVYKGCVEEKTLNPAKSGVGMVVAVKKLNPESVQGLEEWQVPSLPLPRSPEPRRFPLSPCGLWFAVRSKFPGEAVTPKPRQAHGVLLGGEGAPPRVRVHVQRKLGEPPLPT
ncbi:hypothetical protein GW17_00005661 [Ensete ventricosum]|nr:hypothetical protein GW17_00005661 [Ensete ventricosum]